MASSQHPNHLTASTHSTLATHHHDDVESPSVMALDTPSPSTFDDLRSSTPFHGIGSVSGIAGDAADATVMHEPAADVKQVRQRRIMPARLRRVSSLLAGSIEEEIAGAAAKEETASIFSGDTRVILTTISDRYSSEPVIHTFNEKQVLLGHHRNEQIQTPEFRTRDETEVMGKTRSMRSQEDTSDAAFERRHRKADNVEKRLRKWEKENLKKDRTKIVERIEHLKSADVRVLAPILSAREQRHQKAAAAAAASQGEEVNPNDVVNGHAAGSAQTTTQSGKDGEANTLTSSSTADHLAKLERLRDSLIEEHEAVLRRYDALLTVPVDETTSAAMTTSSAAPSNLSRKRKSTQEAHLSTKTTTEPPQVTKPRRTISVSGAFARKAAETSSTASASSSSLKPSSSTSALPVSETSLVKKPNTKYSARDRRASNSSMEPQVPRPFTDEDGRVRAENTYANIHARTNGGRFAPKSALGSAPSSSSTVRSKINTKTGKAKAQQSGATKAAQKGKQKSKGDTPDEKRSRGRPRKSGSPASPSTPVTASAGSHAQATGRSRGHPPSKATSTSSPNGNDGVRTRRVKLILSRNKENGGGASGDSSLSSTPSAPAKRVKHEDVQVDEKDDGSDSDDDMDTDSPSGGNKTTPARSALTLEEAQALLAKAMAEDGEDDMDEDTKDAANAAASIFPME